MSRPFLSGAVDDIWVDRATERLIVVDYKTTTRKSGEAVLEDYGTPYKRQVSFYQWLLRGNGFQVSDTAYFLFAKTDQRATSFGDTLKFEMELLPVNCDTAWVEKTIVVSGGRLDPALGLTLTVENRGEHLLETRLGLTWDLMLLGGGGNPAAYHRIGGERGLQQLDRHLTGERQVGRHPDLGHATLREPSLQPVTVGEDRRRRTAVDGEGGRHVQRGTLVVALRRAPAMRRPLPSQWRSNPARTRSGSPGR